MLRKPLFLIFAAFLTSAIIALASGIYASNQIFKQSEFFRQTAVASVRQPAENTAQQLIQYAFWAEVSCKNAAFAALVGSILILFIGGLTVFYCVKKIRQ